MQRFWILWVSRLKTPRWNGCSSWQQFLADPVIAIYSGMPGGFAFPDIRWLAIDLAIIIRVYSVPCALCASVPPCASVCGICPERRPGAMEARDAGCLYGAARGRLGINTQRFSAAHPYNPDPHASTLIMQRERARTSATNGYWSA